MGEIREQAVQFVKERIEQASKNEPGSYGNIGVMRSNAMMHLPHYFEKGQLNTILFCFPDPHFKKRLRRRRILSSDLLTVYGYVLKPGGRLYTITDVKEYHEWTV